MHTKSKKSGTRKTHPSSIEKRLSPIKEETSPQLRSNSVNSKGSRSLKLYNFKRKTAGRTIKKFMKTHRSKIQLRFLNTICSDSNVCIAFGKECKKIRNFFDDFDFNLLSKPPKVVGSSSNGTVQLLTYEKDKYLANAIFKTSNKESADNLNYEAIVGMFINKQKLRFPCFLETYGLFRNENLNAIGKDINHYKKIDINIENLIISCEKPLSISILIENIKESKTLKDTLMSLNSQYTNFMNFELLYILYQIYAPLSMLCEVFTHYDLHYSNVMLYEPVKRKHIEYHYHYPDRVVKFNSGYIVKIIDYGRCFFKDETGYNPRDIYGELCDSEFDSNCKDCGKGKGFGWLEPSSLNYNSSQKRNMSHDLRLLNLLKYFKPDYNSDLNNLINSTIYKTEYGTPELKLKNSKSICNVNDAALKMENLIKTEYFQKYNDYDPDLKLGEMHIYSDGRHMKYISV